MIVKSYARHISTEAAISTIIADVRQSNERTMDPKTFDDYMDTHSGTVACQPKLLSWHNKEYFEYAGRCV